MKNSTSKIGAFSDMLKALEQLAEDQQGTLVGGFFSMSGSAITDLEDFNHNNQCTNNCSGGNCIAGCG